MILIPTLLALFIIYIKVATNLLFWIVLGFGIFAWLSGQTFLTARNDLASGQETDESVYKFWAAFAGIVIWIQWILCVGAIAYVLIFISSSPNSSIDNSEISDSITSDIDQAMYAQMNISEANTIVKDMLKSPNTFDQDFEHFGLLINKTLQHLEKCNINKLNRVYSDWGTTLKNHLHPAIKIYNDAYLKVNEKDMTVIEKMKMFSIEAKGGDYHLLKYDEWMFANWNQILTTLKERYGYKIKGKI